MLAITKICRNLKLGLSSLWAHKLRSALTALGIVFGVASVICMLAIGEGLSYEAREQIKRLGSNNIIVRSVRPPREMEATGTGTRVLQYGLTYADAERIATTVPSVEVMVPSREMRKDIWFRGKRVEGQIIGTVPWYPFITDRRVLAGRFLSSADMYGSVNVCVLSSIAAGNIAGVHSPLHDFVRLGRDSYRVVGVLESAGAGPEAAEGKSQNEVYIPITAARTRFGELIVERSSGSSSAELVELHEVRVRMNDSDDVLPAARVLEALMQRSHDKLDYEMIVPLQLLREKERVKRLYNLVLGLMAAISLLVGGMGIMNIMLANISERTPEIGVRRAIGAKKRDIMMQFLIETVLLSGCGGLLGIVLGVGMARAISRLPEVTTIVTAWSVVLAVGISGIVGLVFGFYPALRAANMDPITALRHE